MTNLLAVAGVGDPGRRSVNSRSASMAGVSDSCYRTGLAVFDH